MMRETERTHFIARAERMRARLASALADIDVLIGDLHGEPVPAADSVILVRPVIAAVAQALQLIPKDITGGSRVPRACTARTVAAHVLHELGMSWSQVARSLRMKHHTSARSAGQRIDDRRHLKGVETAIAAGLVAGGSVPKVEADEPELPEFMARLTFGRHRDDCGGGTCEAGRYSLSDATCG